MLAVLSGDLKVKLKHFRLLNELKSVFAHCVCGVQTLQFMFNVSIDYCLLLLDWLLCTEEKDFLYYSD